MAGYEDTNDAQRLCVDPAMCQVVGERAKDKTAGSVSQMGRFETEILTQPQNLKVLMNQPGRWVDQVHQRKPIKETILDMDSLDSPSLKWTRLSCHDFVDNQVRLSRRAGIYLGA